MTALKVAIGLALILGLSWLLAHKLVPWVVVRAGRLLGLRMRLTPLTERRVRRFKSIKRGYWSFVVITTALTATFFLELYVNHKPLYIEWEGKTEYPAVMDWVNLVWPGENLDAFAKREDYGLKGESEVDYRTYARWVEDPEELERAAARIERDIVDDEARFRELLAQDARDKGLVYDPTTELPPHKLEDYAGLREQAAYLRSLQPAFEAGKASIVMPLVPYSADEQLLGLPGSPPHKPFATAEEGAPPLPVLGTDPDGKDVLSQLLYGFRVSFMFALLVAALGYAVGITVGGTMGYFGGWVDIFAQRVVEVWSSVPFLYIMMIIAAAVTPSFWLLLALLVVLTAWVAITYTVRGEFYREKARDYVQAAHAIGVSHPAIMMRHILPNALVPVVTYLPFSIVAYVTVLVSLDFLGFGLPPAVPSWGRLLKQGYDNITNHPHLVYFPVAAIAVTLFCVVVIGEAVREAFDPKKYARLR